jgi:hypothetical protein
LEGRQLSLPEVRGRIVCFSVGDHDGILAFGVLAFCIIDRSFLGAAPVPIRINVQGRYHIVDGQVIRGYRTDKEEEEEAADLELRSRTRWRDTTFCERTPVAS